VIKNIFPAHVKSALMIANEKWVVEGQKIAPINYLTFYKNN
jgi:hypothetical protein